MSFLNLKNKLRLEQKKLQIINPKDLGLKVGRLGT